MPKFMSDMEETYQAIGPGSIEFSATRPEELEEMEYTLVGIAVDTTGSVMGFEDELLECLKVAVQACEKAPRSENLLVRVTLFNSMTGVVEIHGFRPLVDIDVNVHYTQLQCGGATPLFDSTLDQVAAIRTYGEDLFDQDFGVNAVLFIITDGDDNVSTSTPSMIADQIKAVAQSEKIESLQTVLIGVNMGNGSVKRLLEEFQKDAELTQFIDAGNASKGTFAHLAGFVSQSVSSTSQALGSGGPSQLTF